ncbi:hypothetical protein DICVIV_06223 [Dictyocaulus viviparus]|uniref:C2 domain-containing protein n=1 Tax=Dictyocaulus viviparus TaxID=29172 RepID=A0A0D8XVA5_DICVI|nr:hypothetical protein DICVIV_06223 [Dictyocaulus viviparus]
MKSRILGELKMMSSESSMNVATIKYELNTTDEELASHVRLLPCNEMKSDYVVPNVFPSEIGYASSSAAELAQEVLPIRISHTDEEFRMLTIIVNRCTGLDMLGKGEMEVCVVYEFLSFSPYFTNTVKTTEKAEFNSKRDWSVPLDAVLSNLIDTEIAFFLFDNRPNSNDEKGEVLAMLSLPLAPLAKNQTVEGSFEMIKKNTVSLL